MLYYIFLALFAVFVILVRARGKKKNVLKSAPFLNQSADDLSPYAPGQAWNSDRKVAKPVRMAKSGIAGPENPARTIPDILKSAVQTSGNKPAMRIEHPVPKYDAEKKVAAPSAPFAEWKTWSYQEYYDQVRVVGRAFLGLGLKRFDAVTVYGFNSPEWFMGMVGGIFAGGICAGIYPSDTPAQVVFKARHSSASIAVCEAHKAQIFADAAKRGDLPNLKAIVTWGGPDTAEQTIECKNSQVVTQCTWGNLDRLAKGVTQEALDEVSESLEPGHACCYIYTSGTTGDPKAVMITHDNIVFESVCALKCLPKSYGNSEERILSYLPLSHVAGCMVDIVMPMVTTATMPGFVTSGFARNYDLSKFTFGDRLRAVKPTIFLGVPRVWEKIAAKIKKIGKTTKGLKAKISAFAKAKGLEHARNCQLGESGIKPPMYPIANKLVFSKIKAVLGLDECKFGFTGAAPITLDTLEYFGQLGLQINEVYGMSECTGATTFSSDEAHVWGSCGWNMPGTEVKIFQVSDSDINDKKECPRAADIFNVSEIEQGEICFRGRHIMAGYMANPDLGPAHVQAIKKKNEAAIDNDGWLHSGDKGCMGTNGMVKITGRYKDLIIGSGGENIAPVPIEDSIKKLCPAVSNIVMIGDKRQFNVALVTLKAVGATGEFPGGTDLEEDARALCSAGVTTIPAAAKDEKLIAAIQKAIEDTNNDGSVCPSNAAKIRKFSILPLDFSVETEELTPTLKTKRPVVTKKNAAIINQFYEAANKKNNYVPYQA